MARTLTVAGAGEIRLGGMFKSSAELVADDGTTWQAKRSGLRQKISITDAAGGEPARYEPKGTFKRGGELVVGTVTYALRPSSKWKEHYALVRSEEELAGIKAGGWTGTKIEVETTGDVEPLVLLTACWLVRQFAEDSGSAAAAAAGA